MVDTGTGHDLAALAARADAGEAFTPTEAEALVRAIRRECRGPALKIDAIAARLEAEAGRFENTAERFEAAAAEGLVLVEGEPEAMTDEDKAARRALAEKAREHAVETRGLAALARKFSTARNAIAALMGTESEVGRAQARRLDAFRQPCGQDVNTLILAGPLDGEEHAVVCPRCGIEISYRAPGLAVAATP